MAITPIAFELQPHNELRLSIPIISQVCTSIANQTHRLLPLPFELIKYVLIPLSIGDFRQIDDHSSDICNYVYHNRFYHS